MPEKDLDRGLEAFQGGVSSSPASLGFMETT